MLNFTKLLLTAIQRNCRNSHFYSQLFVWQWTQTSFQNLEYLFLKKLSIIFEFYLFMFFNYQLPRRLLR